MKIPLAEYTLESFLEYIVEHSEEVFSEDMKRLKCYLLYIDKNWKKIFSGASPVEMGEMMELSFPDKDRVANFYAYEWNPGIIMMFASSTEDVYERTLRNFMQDKAGISQLWIKPTVLEDLKNYLVSTYDAQMYRFIARRHRFWKTPARIRPDENRRISYSGEDSFRFLKEVQELYGVIPSSIDMRIGDSKIQINRNGLFVVRRINLKTIGMLREMVDRVVEQQITLRNTSEKFNVATKEVTLGNKHFRVPQVVAGKIVLPGVRLSGVMISRMFGHEYDGDNIQREDNEDDDDIQADFSFVDTFVKEGPFVFSATVVDEAKGTVFGLSGIENEIALIPKHRTTFESFIKFYNFITEEFDQEAKLTTFSEITNA